MPKRLPVSDGDGPLVNVAFRCPMSTIQRFDEVAKRNERTRSGHLRWVVEQEGAKA